MKRPTLERLSLSASNLSFSGSNSFRRPTYQNATLEYPLESVEKLLSTLAIFSSDEQELRTLDKYWGLADRCIDNFYCCEVDEVVTLLGALISSSSSLSLPPCLLAEIHSCIGMIRSEQQQLQGGIRSLLMALWIQKNAAAVQENTEAVDIAITEHRLALIYGRAGNYRQAVCLLEKALSTYDEANMKLDHTCRIQAQASLNQMRQLQLQQCLVAHPKASLMGHITEVDETLVSEAFTVTSLQVASPQTI